MMEKTRHAHTTLAQVLGELELCVMEQLWDQPGQDARGLCDSIGQRRAISLSTVQSTLERLVRKGYLQRSKQGHAYRYHPERSRSDYMGSLLHDVIRLLHDGRAATILSSFVNVAASLDVRALDELEELIRQKRRLQARDQRAQASEADDD